jgi:methylmalonyl-CoA mutase N-terminal domain/subunit
VQREIQESAYRWQLAVASCDKTIVGVNRFWVEEKQMLNLLRVDPEVGARQTSRLHALRERRGNEMVSNALSELRLGAQNDDNVVPLILRAVESCATLGEICAVLRESFGEHQAHTLF